MKPKSPRAARLTGIAAVAAVGALLAGLTPAGAAPQTSDIEKTVNRLEAEAAKLTEAQKRKLVKEKDHAMGSQIRRVEGVKKNLGTSIPDPGVGDLINSAQGTVNGGIQKGQWRTKDAHRAVQDAVNKGQGTVNMTINGVQKQVPVKQANELINKAQSVTTNRGGAVNRIQIEISRAHTKGHSAVNDVQREANKTVNQGQRLLGVPGGKGGGTPGAPSPGEPTNDAPRYGIDVSGHQQNVDWKYWWGKGKRHAFVKATEGTGYKNPYFSQQYNGSADVGMKRGSYHFALPNNSSGAAQANYFVDNGGGWSKDGKTLPGALDMEWNPYGSTCYGKSQAGMRAWIKDFHDTYKARTGRYPVIYTGKSWWDQCVGGGHNFGDTVPLWVARYSDSPGALPAGWSNYTFWQYSSDPIDQNEFNGSSARLSALANG